MRWNTMLTCCAALLCCVAALGADKDDKKKDKDKKKEDKIVWKGGATSGSAVQLRTKNRTGLMLIYEGSLRRVQTAVNSYDETASFFLSALCADQREGFDFITTRQTYTERNRDEILENKKRIKRDALPLLDELIDMGPNFTNVGTLRCYPYDTQNRLGNRADDLLSLRDGTQLRGQIIAEDANRFMVLTSTDKLDVPRSSVTSVTTLDVPHVLAQDSPHFLFPILPTLQVSPGDTWTFKVPVVIPQEQGVNALLPTQFMARMTGRLRGVSNGVATIDFQVTGSFDSGAEEYAGRFPRAFHERNTVRQDYHGEGVATFDVDKGRFLSRDETVNIKFYTKSLLPPKIGEEPKTEEKSIDLDRTFSIKLLPPGSKLKNGGTVPDYETMGTQAAAPSPR